MAYMYDVFNNKQGPLIFTDDDGREINLGEGRKSSYPLSEAIATSLSDKGYKVTRLAEAGSVVSIAGIASPAAGFSGQVAMDGTVKQIPSNIPKSGVTLKAPAANTQVVYVGFNSDVSASTGFPLSPGDQVPVVIGDTGLIYCFGTSGDNVAFLGS